MKLDVQLGYWGAHPPADALDKVQAAERLGFDTAFTAESWGSDAFSPLAFWAAQRSQNRGILTRKHQLVLPIMLVVAAVGFFLLISPEASSASSFAEWEIRLPATLRRNLAPPQRSEVNFSVLQMPKF